MLSLFNGRLTRSGRATVCVEKYSPYFIYAHESIMASFRKSHFDAEKLVEERPLGVDERTVLLLKKWDSTKWIGFIWPRL
jgi:hypothetical protein